MTQYEYKHLITGKTFTVAERLTEDEMKEQNVKRIYALGFQLKSTDWGHE